MFDEDKEEIEKTTDDFMGMLYISAESCVCPEFQTDAAPKYVLMSFVL